MACPEGYGLQGEHRVARICEEMADGPFLMVDGDDADLLSLAELGVIVVQHDHGGATVHVRGMTL